MMHHGPIPATMREVRLWLIEQGEDVGVRGVIAKRLVDKFVRETGRPIGRVELPETR